MHRIIAGDVLRTALLGSVSIRHPEWIAFFEGMRLPCRNGFDFGKVRFPILD